MKHSQNNLSVILTYAVPTAAALLGLLWLLRRRKDKDEDDDGPPAADASTLARKERSGIVTAPSTLPKERWVGDEVLEKQKVAPSHVSAGDGSAQKMPPKKAQPGSGIMKTPASDGRALGAGDRLTGSVHVSSFSATTVSSSAPPAPSDRQDQSAAAAHSSKVSSVLSSILPASSTGVERDPVQVLVSSNEAKLKQDDASIVQAKLSTSTLQSLPPNSSTSSSSFCSSDPFQANAQKDPSQNPQEALFAKEIVREVLTQAAHVHAQSLSAASDPAKPGPCATDTSAGRSNTPSTVTSILKQSTLKDSPFESPGRLGGANLESVGAASPSRSQSNLANRNSSESPSRNSNSNINNSGSSAQESELLPRVAVSRAGILLQKTSSGEKTENHISKQESDQNPSNKKHETVSESSSSSAVRVSIESKSEKAKPSSESASVKDLKSSADATQVVQSKDTLSEKESASKTSLKSAPAKDGRSNQGSQSKDKSSSSSVKSASPSASAKASSQRQTGKAATRSEKQPSNQSKTSSQQKLKSAPTPSNNSYSSKRRTRSGSSTGDVASDGSPEGHDSGSQASPGVMENGRLPDSGSPVCDTNSEASNDSGRGGSVGETLVPISGGEVVRYEFNFPSDLCGRLIGRGGKNIQQIKDQSGANVTLSSNPFTPEFQICCVQGMQPEVDRALMLIRKKFPLAQYPHLDMVSLAPIPPPAPVVLPEIMQYNLQLNLPEGVSVDIVVSAIVNAGHIFVQQPTHPTFPSLERLNHFMNACYGDQNVPLLPRPVEGGIICAAESEGQWYRAQVVQVYPVEDECDIKYVDYGGYTRVPVNTLKQIRSDFMTLPFQAVECYLANITPLQEEEYFSDRASEVLAELTSGKMLQGQVIARGEDSICYVHLYQVSGHSVLMINREMVNREVVRWIEIL